MCPSFQYFPDGVFWFRVGMLERDKLFHRMKILCEKLDAPTVPTSTEHAQEILRKLFTSPEHFSHSLLILDDVWSAGNTESDKRSLLISLWCLFMYPRPLCD